MPTKWKLYWLLVALTVVNFLALSFWAVPVLQELAGGEKMFDLRCTGYAFDDAKSLLEALGKEGRELYLSVQKWLDTSFPALVGLVLVVSLIALERGGWGWLLSVFAVAGPVFDYMENFAVAVMLEAGPEGLTRAMVDDASSWTLLKWAGYAIAIAGLLVLGVIAIIGRLRGEGNAQQANGDVADAQADEPKQTIVIAIDGPAASGKGTLARRLAEQLGLPHLDTGLTYRAVVHALLQESLPLDDEELAEAKAREIDLGQLDRKILSDHAIGEAASKVALMSKVRAALVEAQRRFAASPPGAVLDGRDIGTVVRPDADVKLYVTASAEVRARRRFDEIGEKGSGANYEEILADIKRRDERDASRNDSPMKQAEDAHLIDTSDMDIETAFQTALAIVEKKINDKENGR